MEFNDFWQSQFHVRWVSGPDLKWKLQEALWNPIIFKFSGQHRMDLKANLKSKNGGSPMEFNDFYRFQVRSVVGIYNTKGNA